MYISVKKKTNSGETITYLIHNVENVIVFDDVKARLQVDSDCCVRTPVRPKDELDNVVELE